MIVRMVMVRMPFTVLSCYSLSRGEDESPGLNPLGANQIIGEVTDFPGWAAQ